MSYPRGSLLSLEALNMDRARVAKVWIYYGLADLYFAFDNDDIAFEDSARFAEIMGLEKFLKAVLLFHRPAEYESLWTQKLA